MTANFEHPSKDQQYEALLASIRDLFEVVGTLFDSRGDTPDNIPEFAKRWDNANARFQEWDDSAWKTKLLGIQGGGTGAATAGGARSALGVDSSGEVDTKIEDHNNIPDAHGASSTNQPSSIVRRSENNTYRAGVPQHADDVTRLADLTEHANATDAHGATSSHDPSSTVRRDASGRTRFGAGQHPDDAARLADVDAHADASAPHSGHVPTTRKVDAGNGLTGGGALNSNQTITMGTPGTLDGSTSNAVTANSHTHKVNGLLAAPAAGNTVFWDVWGTDEQEVSGEDWYEDIWVPYVEARQVAVKAVLAGTIRIKVSHRGTTAGSEVRILKNGSKVAGVWSSGTGSWSENTANISVAINDLITVQHRPTGGSGTARWRYVHFCADKADMAYVI